MAINRKDAGQQGEQRALEYLQDRNLSLLIRNYRCRTGEIDLVMMDGTTLALIEVRFRQDRSFGGAAASVQTGKQQRLLSAARHLLNARPALQRYRARFDVVAIEPDSSSDQTAANARIEWIKDAFRS